MSTNVRFYLSLVTKTALKIYLCVKAKVLLYMWDVVDVITQLY